MADLQSSKLTLTKIQNGQDGQQGAPGADGANGYNAATIFLYARVQSRPSAPSNTLKYIFSSGTFDVTTPVPSPWSQQMPQNNNYPCYVAVASAVSNIEYDEIESNDWTVQELVENGAQGAPGTNGADGYNFATIYLYQRAASIPSVPTGCTYKFSNNSITGNIGNWQRTVPDNTTNTNPCWVTTAVVYSRNDENNSLSFVTPTIMVKDGENGQDGSDGTNGYNYIILYYYIRSATTPTKPSGTYSYDFENKQLSGATITDWTTSIPDINVNHDPCWVTTISFLGNTTIVSGQTFSNPVKLVEDGEDAGQYQLHTSQQRFLRFLNSNSQTNILYEISPSVFKFTVQNLQTNQLESFSESNIDIRLINSFLSFDESYSSEYSIKNELNDFNINGLYWEIDNDSHNSCTININNLYNFTQYEKPQTIDQGFYNALKDFFEKLQGNLYISVTTDDYKVEKFFAIQNGLSDEILKFQINAASINALVDTSKLIFDNNGLRIVNGDFTLSYTEDIIEEGIIKTKEIPIFNIDQDGRSIKMNGSGTFSGNISATSGNIGGFIIQDNTISSDGLILTSKHIENDTEIPSKIEVQNIDIGNGANITDYLQIGNLKILNPDTHNDYVMKLDVTTETDGEVVTEEKFSLKNNGIINLTGVINATGGNFTGTVKSSIIDACTINTVNFVTQKTRSMGGSYIFKPTFNISSQENSISAKGNNIIEFTLEDNNILEYLKSGIQTTFEQGLINSTSGNNANSKSRIRSDFINYYWNGSGPTYQLELADGYTGQTVSFRYYRADKSYIGTSPTTEAAYIRIQISIGSSSSSTYTIIPEAVKFFELINGTIKIISISGNDGIRYGKFYKIVNNKVQIYFYNNDYEIISEETSNENYKTLTYFGIIEYDNIIGINSDNNYTGNFLPPRALTMINFSNLKNAEDTGYIEYTTDLVLGDLSNVPDDIPISGYGLFANNVYLRGSLVTENTNNAYNYAGINTQGPVDFKYSIWNKDGRDDEYQDHKIIFWGGANSINANDIQSAPFIVTDKGSIFACSGEFKGSVISDSTIANSIIKAPIIYGTGSNPSLKIYDTGANGGIGFYQKINNIDEGNENDDVLTLSIDITGFTYKSNSQKFIEFKTENNTNKVIANLDQVNFNNLQINETGISRKQKENETLSNIYFKFGNEDRIIISSDGVVNTGNEIESIGNIKFTSISDTYENNLEYTVRNGYHVLFVKKTAISQD